MRTIRLRAAACIGFLAREPGKFADGRSRELAIYLEPR